MNCFLPLRLPVNAIDYNSSRDLVGRATYWYACDSNEPTPRLRLPLPETTQR